MYHLLYCLLGGAMVVMETEGGMVVEVIEIVFIAVADLIGVRVLVLVLVLTQVLVLALALVLALVLALALALVHRQAHRQAHRRHQVPALHQHHHQALKNLIGTPIIFAAAL